MASMTEEQLLRMCRLDLSRPEDERIYETMKEEVMQGLRRLRAINIQSSAGAQSEAPFNIAQNDEGDVVREINRIYAEASPSTKRVYDQSTEPHAHQGDNWIIRSLLWLLGTAFSNAPENGDGP